MKLGAAALLGTFYVVACSSSGTNPTGDGGNGGTGGASSGGTGGAAGSVACPPPTCTTSCCLTTYSNQASTLSKHINAGVCGCSDCSSCSACDCPTTPASAAACYKCLLDNPLATDTVLGIQSDCSLSNQCSALLDCVAQCSDAADGG